ncbi:MAG: tyrosine-type recombinase/integrase [Actinobacteria bacterium]|nr:tyrosine-type recombinase/integrase [Actinomycetota bacterium]
MASVWIVTRLTRSGDKRHRVEFRVAGRSSAILYAGSFKTLREAEIRYRWIADELAAERVPDVRALARKPAPVSIATLAERWRASRLDVASGTLQTYRVNLGRLLPRVGTLAVSELTAERVAALVVELVDDGLARESLRKTLSTLAQVLDHAGVQPNPVRDPRVKLPRGEKRHVSPPTAEHVEAVYRILPTRYRLPLLVLDASGMRVGELEQLAWGDVDEPRGRWRVSAGVSKTGAARWVQVPGVLFEAVTALVARDDRTRERRVFGGFGADRFRTAITRACTAAAVPVFSPHDLRHRRVSLLHLGGMPWARIGELVGHGDIVTTARTYTHVVADEAELDYAELVS